MGTTFCIPNCCRIEEGNEGFIEVEKSQAKGSDHLVRTSRTHKGMYQYTITIIYHYAHTQHTHTHLFVWLNTIFRTWGTQFETLYGNHISNATNIYLYIQHAIYIYMTIQQQRETIASFPLSL